jgi:hypothetical protein
MIRNYTKPTTTQFPFYTITLLTEIFNNNNNNQAFYSQASWGRLKMKPHKPKKIGTKQERKRRGKQRAIKKLNKKRRKDNKMLSQKSEKGVGKKT